MKIPRKSLSVKTTTLCRSHGSFNLAKEMLKYCIKLNSQPRKNVNYQTIPGHIDPNPVGSHNGQIRQSCLVCKKMLVSCFFIFIRFLLFNTFREWGYQESGLIMCQLKKSKWNCKIFREQIRLFTRILIRKVNILFY